jgi:hypothetical protein
MSTATYRGVRYETHEGFNELALIQKKLKMENHERKLLMDMLRKALKEDQCPV